MSHLDEGTILAIRDGELVVGDARAHLTSCGRCRTALEEVEVRASAVASSLATMDSPVDLETARAEVRARMDARRDADRVAPGLGTHLGRAAAILALAAGTAYAMPGSPVRDWLTGSRAEEAAPAAAAPAGQEHPVVGEGGIEVDLAAGAIRVVISGLRPGATLEVSWTDRTTARIVAGPESSFSVGQGRAEATVAPGPVRVELPRDASSVSVEVNGRTYLRRAGDGLEVLVPATEHSAERIRFVAPPR